MTATQQTVQAYSKNDSGPVNDLTLAEIEAINAHGPFNHSVWRGRGVTVTHEESLTGRVEFLSGIVRQAITKHFSKEQLSQMSIVDVGCYDGWLLESLSDLPFANLVGIEPRPENIQRGKRVREILRIPSRAHYQVGEIDTLDTSRQFDVVLCMGVVHHLESIQAGLQKLRGICKRLLIIESLCLPPSHLTPELKRDVELKDMVYRYKPEVFGVTAQKYEGHYYPGSGVRFSVVNVPSVQSLRMHLDVLGFHSVNVLVDWKDYRAALIRNHRPINAVCLAATIDQDVFVEKQDFETKCASDYERGMLANVLSEGVIDPLHTAICANGSSAVMSDHGKGLYETYQNRMVTPCFFDGEEILSDANEVRREIVASFVHCPLDKIRLEYAKRLLAHGEVSTAVCELQMITCRINADWRACYRAFYLLWRAFVLLADDVNANRYREHCLKSNPHFPADLFAAPPEFQIST